MTPSPVEWLLHSAEPAVRDLAARDLVDGATPPPLDYGDGPLVAGLLAGQRPDGGFGNHPYLKRGGSFWRTISLVELGMPAGESRALAAARHALDWVCSPGRYFGTVRGLVRRHACQEGFMLMAGTRLGLLHDHRVAQLAHDLIAWQNGTWRPGGYWWKPPGSGGSNVEVVDWGRGGPNEMITLQALRILRAAGRA